MNIRPAHHALLCYAEWCCDNRRPWPKFGTVAADLARNERDLGAAFAELVEWGLVSERYCGCGYHRVLRLGDGRETVPYIHVIHRRTVRPGLVESAYDDARISA